MTSLSATLKATSDSDTADSSSLPPTTTPNQLLQFLTAATGRLQSSDFLQFLGSHLSQHPATDRSAVFEQVIAYEYKQLFPRAGDETINDADTLPDTFLGAAEWSEETKRANLEAQREPDERNDAILHQVLSLLDYYVNEKPDPRITPSILQGWQQLEMVEERIAVRATLPDAEFASMLERDRACDAYGAECYNTLNITITLMPPQERLTKITAMQQAGMAALMAHAPNFQELEPVEKQQAIQSMPYEERKPVIKMNVLNVVMKQMQKIQILGQRMAQQFMQVIPSMAASQQRAQLAMLQEKAYKVLPDNFPDLSVEKKQQAVMAVPFDQKMPVMRWNSMIQALTMLNQQQRHGGGGGGGGAHGHSHNGQPCHVHGHGH
jgi:hypothetical protein